MLLLSFRLAAGPSLFGGQEQSLLLLPLEAGMVSLQLLLSLAYILFNGAPPKDWLDCFSIVWLTAPFSANQFITFTWLVHSMISEVYINARLLGSKDSQPEQALWWSSRVRKCHCCCPGCCHWTHSHHWGSLVSLSKENKGSKFDHLQKCLSSETLYMSSKKYNSTTTSPKWLEQEVMTYFWEPKLVLFSKIIEQNGKTGQSTHNEIWMINYQPWEKLKNYFRLI